VQHAVGSGWADVTLGLRAIDEGTTNQWKRFNASTPALAIDYNTPPNTPDQLTVDGKACASGANRPFVATATPTLRARATDPDATRCRCGTPGCGGTRRRTRSSTRAADIRTVYPTAPPPS
jgi:hypothetical protein